MSTDDKHFNANRVFVWLLIYTVAEVAWGYAGDWLGWGRVLLWGGLLLCAAAKGYLILSYFMHFRYEGWIVKGLVAPTPLLVLVILAALNPDVASNKQLDHPIGAKFNDRTSQIDAEMHAHDAALYDEEEGGTH